MSEPVIIMPAIALRGTTILPGMVVHFDISRKRSMKAIEAAMVQDQKIFLVTQRNSRQETPELRDLYQTGTIAYVKQVVKLPQNLLRVLVEGTEKADLLALDQEEPYLKAEVSMIRQEEEELQAPVKAAMHRSIHDLFQQYCQDNGKMSKEMAVRILDIADVEELIQQVAVNLPLTYQSRQKFLEASGL